MNDISKLSSAEIQLIGELNKELNMENANRVARPVHPRDSFYTRHGKRWIDFCIALVAFIVALPINLVIGVITFFDVGRPVFFKQSRTGKDGREFKIVKFRNMTNETDAHGELLPPEQRVTKFGQFVRKTSLDELLNFWSILKGDMSIIGPRPLHCYYTDWMSERHALRHAVRPGLECPFPKSRMKKNDWEARFENDLWYVENCSLWLDICLLFRLVEITLFPQNKDERAGGDSGAFIGYNSDGSVMNSQNISDELLNRYLEKCGYRNLEEAQNARFIADPKPAGKSAC